MTLDGALKDMGEQSSALKHEVASCFTGIFCDKVNQISPEILAMDEAELQSHFKPTINDFFIRQRVFSLLRAQKSSGLDGKIEVSKIFDGICTKTNFHSRLLINPYRHAWYLIPIAEDAKLMEEGFYSFLRKVREEFLTLPVNEKTAGPIMKALEFFANRHLGPTIQRIEQKSMNLNVTRNEKDVSSLNPEEMLKKYEELQSKLRTLPATVISDDE